MIKIPVYLDKTTPTDRFNLNYTLTDDTLTIYFSNQQDENIVGSQIELGVIVKILDKKLKAISIPLKSFKLPLKIDTIYESEIDLMYIKLAEFETVDHTITFDEYSIAFDVIGKSVVSIEIISGSMLEVN